MKMTTLFAMALMVGVLAPGQIFADADFQITEVYSGLSGEDGTEDWIEITNFGTMAGDTSSLFYEDDSADPANGQQLPAFILQPGESAVVLVSVSPEDQMGAIDEFNTVWNGVANVGAVDGGGLGGGGDTVFLFDSMDPMAEVVDSATYLEDDVDVLLGTLGDGTGIYSTVQFLADGTAFASSISGGLSNPFFNDNLGTSNETVILAGNPGATNAIPEPTSALILSISLCALARRRR